MLCYYHPTKAEKRRQNAQLMSPASKQTVNAKTKSRMQKYRERRRFAAAAAVAAGGSSKTSETVDGEMEDEMASEEMAFSGFDSAGSSDTIDSDEVTPAAVGHLTDTGDVRLLITSLGQAFHLQHDNAKVSYLFADGHSIGDVSDACNATCAFMTVGSQSLILEVGEARRTGRLKYLNRIFAMRPTAGYPEEMEKLWHVVMPPRPTVMVKRKGEKGCKRAGTGRFLRYEGGLVTRSSVFYFWKEDFNPDGTPLHPSGRDATTAQQMDDNLASLPWRTPETQLYAANIPGGCHNVTRLCVLDTLLFWRAGPHDTILDVGFGQGTMALTATAALKCHTVGVENCRYVYDNVFYALSMMKSIVAY